MSSIAVPEVTPRIRRSKPGLVCLDVDDELAVSESPLTLLCRASRYLCPTGVRTRPLGAGMRPFIIANLLVSSAGSLFRRIEHHLQLDLQRTFLSYFSLSHDEVPHRARLRRLSSGRFSARCQDLWCLYCKHSCEEVSRLQ
jgi:hypothetical protein